MNSRPSNSTLFGPARGMHVRTLLFVVPLVVFPTLLFADSPGSKSPSPKGIQPIEIVVKSVSCGSGPYQPKLPATINGFKALGKRTKEQIQPASDYSGDPTTHTSGNFWYDGMELGVVFRNQKPYGKFIEGATFSHKRWNHLTPIAVGSSVIDLLSKENISVIPPRNSIVSICGSDIGAPDCINLKLKEHTIIEVKYECYTG